MNNRYEQKSVFLRIQFCFDFIIKYMKIICCSTDFFSSQKEKIYYHEVNILYDVFDHPKSVSQFAGQIQKHLLYI